MDSQAIINIIREKYENVSDVDCICNACRQKFSTKVKNSSYTPQKTRKKERKDLCSLSCASECASVSTVEASDISLQEFNSAFSLNLEEIPKPTLFCQKHRAQMSNYQVINKCAVCSYIVKSSQKKYSLYDHKNIDRNLLKIINTDFVEGEKDIICKQCYKFSFTGRVVSEVDVENMERVLMLDEEKLSGSNLVLDKICNNTFKQICTWTKTDYAFLLTNAYDFFLVELEKQFAPDSYAYHDAFRTCSWLLTKILTTFGNLFSVHRMSKKKGVLFYVKNIQHDQLISSLHNSHSKIRYLLKKGNDNSEDVYVDRDCERAIHEEGSLGALLSDGNKRLKQQTKNINETFTSSPLAVADFNLLDAVSSFDPIIWNIVSLLTSNLEEMRFFKQSSICITKDHIRFPNESTSHGMQRTIRRIVIVFILQFALTDTCTYPFHIIIANIVKRMSHSSKLLKIMNRLGLCCSESTLDRFLQHVKDDRDANGSLSSLNNNSFTHVSIDNIDVLASHAAVTADQVRSWHGTSIMAQQPKPDSEVLHSTFERLDIPSTSTAVSIPSTSTAVSIPRTKKPSARKKIKLSHPLDVPTKDYFQPTQFKTYIRSQISWETFIPSELEKNMIYTLNNDMFLYVLERYSGTRSEEPSIPLLPSFKCKMLLDSQNPTTEKSQFSYLYVLDEPADTKQTLQKSIQLLYDLFEIGRNVNHLIVAGDGATFKMLLNIKREYGAALDWLIPYIGDWHLLKNYQEVLMKIFWDAGLKDLAKVTHKNMTLNSLSSCSNFKRTHKFLLQVHEALFMFQFQCFLNYRDGKSNSDFSNEMFLDKIQSVIKSFEIHDDTFDTGTFGKTQEEFKNSEMYTSMKDEFMLFCAEMSEKLHTFKFWNDFIHRDCMSYIQLYIAIRSGNWGLRNAALKEIAPLFHACDRQNYSKMIPIHLSMMEALPEHILVHFRNGAFVSSIKGMNFSSVALDEAHEMLINKHCKMALCRSLPKNMEKIAGTIQYQAKLITHFEEQLEFLNPSKSVLHRDLSPSVIKSEFSNVKLYLGKLLESSMFLPDQDSGLCHVFTRVPASKDQETSLLSYRQIGQDAYSYFCKFQILKDTSVEKPVLRKHNLKTFAKPKVTRRKLSSYQKEVKMVTLCCKRLMASSQERNQPINTLCQFIEKPRAICDRSNLPQKGAKYVMYNIFDKRYGSNYNIVSSSPTITQKGACLIAEGMNIIYTSPLKHYRTFNEYASFIVDIWVLTRFKKGFRDVRILFDQFDTQGISPKCIERSRRDQGDEDSDSTVDEVVDDTPLPQNWSKFLHIRKNKHALIRYLSRKIVDIVKSHLQDDQIFITSGGFHVGLQSSPGWSGVVVTSKGVENHSLVHNHEESDTQIFLHVYDTPCSHVLIYSIDRDVGVVSLPLNFSDKTVCIQYNAKVGEEKYLNVNMLQDAIKADSDLSAIISQNIDVLKCIQMLYICSGCDFVSYFAHLGKSKFMNVFFQYASFISGENTPFNIGNLSCSTVNGNSDLGLLSFYRLILCVYFKAKRACLHQYDSPVQLFASVNGETEREQHENALDKVRKASWLGCYEDELLPSNTALQYHWLRSCWVSTVWSLCTTPQFQYPDLVSHGYVVTFDNNVPIIEIMWDSEENMTEIRNNVAFLTRGCACKKNKCVNKRCKCRKNGKLCGPGCRCNDCSNVLERSQPEVCEPLDISCNSDSSEEEGDISSDDEDEEVVNNVDEALEFEILFSSDEEFSDIESDEELPVV